MSLHLPFYTEKLLQSVSLTKLSFNLPNQLITLLIDPILLIIQLSTFPIPFVLNLPQAFLCR